MQANLPVHSSKLQYPLAVLDNRVTKKGNVAVSQVLIHWSDSAVADATWEDEQELRDRFPEALAWGQANFQGEGIVRNSDQTQLPDEPKARRTLTEQRQGKKKAGKSKEGDAVRPTRVTRANPRYYGPDWAV